MGDTNTGEDEKDVTTETGADDQDESQNDGGADKEAEGAGKSEDENADADADGDEADKGKDDDKSDKSKSKPTPKADEEPQTRKRNIDFILERKNRKIEKLQKEKGSDADQDDKEDEDDLDPEDAKVIDTRVKKILSPFIEKQMQDEDKQEIATFVEQNPDFKPYAAKVEKFAQHPSRKGIPIKAIFYEVAGDDLMKIGADRAKKAGDEAKQTQAGGGNSRGGDAPKDVWSLTPEEFAAEQEKLRNKPRD